MPRTRKAHTILPASLIFTHREQKHYRRWQHTNLPSNLQGALPTAAEYAAFQSWLAQRDSGYFSDTPLYDITCCSAASPSPMHVASACLHTLHPAQKEKVERCPVCVVNAYMQYMSLLTHQVVGGDWRVRQRWEQAAEQDQILQAWYAGKLSLLREIERLEVCADQESKWTSQNPTIDIGGAKTAGEALRIYWDSIERSSIVTPPEQSQSPGAMSFCSESSTSPPRGDTGVKIQRRVSFNSDTSFVEGRPTDYFRRRSPRYEAGKYAIVASEDSDYDVEDEQNGNDRHGPFLLVGPETKKGMEEKVDENEDEEWSESEFEYEAEDESDEESGYIIFDAELEKETSFVVFGD